MTSDVVFETERLIARQWNLDLVGQAFKIYGDPKVTKYIGGQPEIDLDSMALKIQQLIDRNNRLDLEYGSFPLFSKQSGELVGAALVKPLPDRQGNFTEDIEIGWHLGRKFWRQGFATEFGRKLLAIGFDIKKIDKLHAVVDLENPASKNVALRLGMRHIGQTTKYYHGDAIEHYVMTSAEYQEIRDSQLPK